MLEEVLDISTKEVRVRYRFLNESDQEIHTTVAFPFPRYNPYEVNEIPGCDGPKTLMGSFKALVNGKPRKVSPTVYEFCQKDFVPPDRLVVYFYSVGPEVGQ